MSAKNKGKANVKKGMLDIYAGNSNLTTYFFYRHWEFNTWSPVINQCMYTLNHSESGTFEKAVLETIEKWISLI